MCGSISFLPNANICRVYEDVNNIVRQDIWYDTIQDQNTKWLWLVNDIVMTMKSVKLLCGSFGQYLVMQQVY